MALTEPGTLVTPEDLSSQIANGRVMREEGTNGHRELTVRIDQPLPAAMAYLERAFITEALARSKGNIERAAQSLGLSRKGLFLKRQRLGLR